MFAQLVLAAQLAAQDPSIPFEKYQLPNGLTVILSEDHRLPQVAVDIWYHVGAANQVPGQERLRAPVRAHDVLGGEAHRPGALQDPRGHRHLGRARWPTAPPAKTAPTTSRSSRRPSSPPRCGSRATAWPSCSTRSTRRSSTCSATSSPTSGARSYENRPYGTAELRICDLFYPKPHPYYDCVIGTIAEIQSASMDDLRPSSASSTLRTTPRSPSSATSTLPHAKALVAKYFGPIPRQADVARPDIPQPQLPGVIKETIQDQVAKIPQLDLDWVGVKAFDADEPAGDVLARILGGGQGLAPLPGAGPEAADRLRRGRRQRDPHARAASSGSRRPSSRGTRRRSSQPVVEQLLDDVRKNGRHRRRGRAGKARHPRRQAARRRAHRRLRRQGRPAQPLRDVTRATRATWARTSPATARSRPDAVKAFANKYLVKDKRLILDIQPAGSAPADPRGRRSSHATEPPLSRSLPCARFALAACAPSRRGPADDAAPRAVAPPRPPPPPRPCRPRPTSRSAPRSPRRCRTSRPSRRPCPCSASSRTARRSLWSRTTRCRSSPWRSSSRAASTASRSIGAACPASSPQMLLEGTKTRSSLELEIARERLAAQLYGNSGLETTHASPERAQGHAARRARADGGRAAEPGLQGEDIERVRGLLLTNLAQEGERRRCSRGTTSRSFSAATRTRGASRRAARRRRSRRSPPRTSPASTRPSSCPTTR